MSVVKHPLATEKSIRLMESENKLIFVVDLDANKDMIKKDIEALFDVKVEAVNTLVDTDGKKRAYVKFGADTPALDVATKMGLM